VLNQQLGYLALGEFLGWLQTVDVSDDGVPLLFLQELEAPADEAEDGGLMHGVVHVPEAKVAHEQHDELAVDCRFDEGGEEAQQVVEVVQHVVGLVLLDMLFVALDQHLHHFSLPQVAQGDAYLVLFAA
jgi:hypothetical protein